MKVIQITDIHFVQDKQPLHGLNPYERLTSCIADINTNHSDAELCVITGDLVHKGSIEAYESLRDCLSTLSVPYHFIIGNHDNRENIKEIFSNTVCDENGFIQSVVDTAAGRFILLDTVEQGCNWGSYCEKRRTWLQAQLETSGDCRIYMFMHHPPFDIGLLSSRDPCRHPDRQLGRVVESHLH